MPGSLGSSLNLAILINAVDNASSVLGGVGTVVAGLGIAVVAMGAQAVQAAGDFQAGMTSLVTGAGEAQSNLAMVSQGILNMSTVTGTSTQQLTAGMYMIESAGYHGAQGLQVLQTAAEGAKVGNADLGVTANALTTILTDYHMSADQSTAAMNALITTVADGKTHLQDLASSMGSVLPLASSLGISFPQVAGAIATMTNAGMDAQRASMNLANAIRSLAAPNAAAQKSMAAVGLSAQQLKDTLTSQGLTGAIQLVEQHVGKTFPAGSVQAVAAFKAIMGGATGYNVALMLGGKNMQSFEGDVNNISAAMKAGGSSVQGWSLIQQDFNFKLAQAQQALNALMIALGTALIPALSHILSAVTPVISAFSAWISNAHNVQTAMQILGPVALAVIGALVAAFISWAIAAGGAAIATIAATWPILAIGAAIGLLVAAFVALYKNSAPFRAFIQQVGAALQQVWQFLQAMFVPIWQQLVQVFQTQLVPAWNNLLNSIKPIMPELQQFGQMIGGVVVVAVSLLSGAIGAAIGLLGGLLTGIGAILTGIITFFMGFVQTISGIIAFFVDLFTGKWDKLGQDLSTVWGGIVKMFQGVWLFIEGIFVGAINGIIGLVNGFLRGVLAPINFVLSLAHQATVSVPQIPMLAAPGGIGGGGAPPAYQPLQQSQQQGPGAKPGAPTTPGTPGMPGGTNPTGNTVANTPTPTTTAVNNASTAAATRHQQAQAAAAARHAAAQQRHQQHLAAVAAHHQQVLKHHQQVLAAVAARHQAAQQRHQQRLAAAAARHAAALKHHQQVLAAHAARHAQAAAHHKQLVSAVVAAACPESTGTAAMAAGVALPNYGAGTGYSVANPQPQPTSLTGGGPVNLTLHVHTPTTDPKQHGKLMIDIVKQELAKSLRQQSVAPRYTSGGKH